MIEGLPQIHPAIVAVAGALVVGLVPRRLGGWVTVTAAALTGLAVLGLRDGTTWGYDFYGFELTPLRVDDLSLAFAYIFAIALLAGAVFGLRTMGTLERTSALVYAASAFGVVFAGDLVTLFFFWELKVSASVLLVFARRSAASGRAALRYLYVSLAGGVVLLGGVAWWIVGTGSVAFDGLSVDTGAGVLILVGFLVAAAAVPLHAWMPDAYPASTIAGTVFLAAFTSKAAIYALARGFPGTEVLVWVGVVTAIYGVVFALGVNDIRRMLVYSSVSQAGFMITAVGVGTSLAIDGATAHAVAHIAYKGLLLMGAGAVLWTTGRSHLTHLGGLARALPWVTGLYLVGAASIASIPLFSGYATKELGALAIEEAGFEAAYWLLKLASVGTVLVVLYRLPWFTFFAPPADPAAPAVVRRGVPVSMYVAMGALAVVNIAVGVAPRLLYDLLPGGGLLPDGEVYSGFSAYKLAGTLALVAGAAVAFALGRRWLVGRPVRVLDVDWLYRDLPPRLAPAVARLHLPTPTLRAPHAPALPVWLGTLWVSAAVVVTALVVVLAVGMAT